MPTFGGYTNQEGNWHTITYKGYPIASGGLQQYYNLYRNILWLKGKMPSFRKRQKLWSTRGKGWKRGLAMLKKYRFKTGYGGKPKGRGGISGRGLTFQHDRQFIYRKKRMPRRLRKRWGRFVRKVRAVDERGLGTRTVVFNKTFSGTYEQNSTAGNQIVSAFALYGNKSSVSQYDDLNQISALENTGNPTEAAGDTVDKTTKYLFQSAVMDMTIRNTSGDGAVLNDLITLELDIYEISVRYKGYDTTNGSYIHLKSFFDIATGDTKNIGGAGVDIQLTDRGVTPFDIPMALSRYKIKIWKKTKFFLRNAQTLTYQIRDPGRHSITHEELVEGAGCNRIGWTKHVLIIAKAVPGIDVGPTKKEIISVGVTRKYMYKIEGMRDDRDRYIDG